MQSVKYRIAFNKKYYLGGIVLKNTVIRFLSLALVLIISVSCFAGCKNNGAAKPDETGRFDLEKIEKVTVSEMKSQNGRSVIYHNGKPYLYYAIHHRYDHLYSSMDEAPAKSIYEQGVKVAKESGFDTIVVYLNWGRLYDGKKYDFSDLEFQYNIAKKYDMKIHINWFGYNVCGFGGYMSWQKDHEKYPALTGLDGSPKLNKAGEEIPDFSEQIFLDEAYEAIQQVCAWLAVNDTDRRTVAIQLENEPDNNENGTGYWMGQYKNMANHINNIGKAVKESPYSMVTYVNLLSAGLNETVDGYTYKQRIQKMIDMEYIDIVGYDTYTKQTAPRVKAIEYGDNMPVYVEFGPSPYTVPGQTSYVLSNGYGIGFYMLADFAKMSNHSTFVRSGGTNLYIMRDGTQVVPLSTIDDMGGVVEVNSKEFIAMNNSIKAIAELIATQKINNIVCFNNTLKNDVEALKLCNKQKITYIYSDAKEEHGGSGLCVGAADGNFYLYSTRNASYKFDSNIKEVTAGSYADGKWAETGKVTVEGNTFKVEAGLAYRVVLK